MTSKNVRSDPKQEYSAMPWDIVNVFGYAIGVERAVLDYISRNESMYSYVYCSSRRRLRELRQACQTRRFVINQCAVMEPGGNECITLPKEYGGQGSMTSAEELLFGIQSKIKRLMHAFKLELPPCEEDLADYLVDEFALGWHREEGLVDWCKKTVESLGDGVYFTHWYLFSSRFLRDDRDLVEELYTFYERDVRSYPFPYVKCKSNRRAHMERLQEFCSKYGPVVVELDTENIEAPLAIAFLKCIEKELPGAISCVNVYLDGMENKVWRHLSEFITSTVCEKQVTRIRSQKSIMDTAIIASVMDAKYSGRAKGVLLISSDCDFLVLASQIPDMPICYCCSRRRASVSTLRYLRDKELPSVYIDYVVNNLMSARTEQECVKAHVALAIEDSLPNLQSVALLALQEVCPQSKVASYTGNLHRLLNGINLSITNDGTVVVSINEESVG